MSQLRFAEKPAGINVASKSTGWNAAKIIDASCVRTVIKTWCSGPTRIRPTARRRWTVPRSLILLNHCAGQRASCSSCGCANGRGANMSGSCAANDSPGGSAPCCALTNRCVT